MEQEEWDQQHAATPARRTLPSSRRWSVSSLKLATIAEGHQRRRSAPSILGTRRSVSVSGPPDDWILCSACRVGGKCRQEGWVHAHSTPQRNDARQPLQPTCIPPSGIHISITTTITDPPSQPGACKSRTPPPPGRKGRRGRRAPARRQWLGGTAGRRRRGRTGRRVGRAGKLAGGTQTATDPGPSGEFERSGRP